MSFTYADIAEYVDAGLSPSQIADTLNADPRHAADTTVEALVDFLVNEVQVLAITPGNVWTGSLRDAVNSSGSQQLIDGFNRLLANALLKPGGKIRTGSDAEVAALANGLTALAQSAEPAKAPAITEGMRRLTGGRRFGSVAAADVLAIINERQFSQTWTAAQNEYINPAVASGDTTQLAAALRQAADSVEGVLV